MKKSILPAIPILCLILMLLFPALSFEGAENGLLLWFNVVLPTLLPFMLCSSLIVAWGGVPALTGPFAPLFRLMGLSENGSYAFLAGLLCGYPMGAKTAADFVRSGQLRRAEGRRLLAIAAFPSPMFLAGYVRSLMPKTVPFSLAVLAMYLPVPILSVLSAAVYGKEGDDADRVPGGKKKHGTGPAADARAGHREARQRRAGTGDRETGRHGAGASVTPTPAPPFDAILMTALETMVKIGGYIMLFSILVLFARHFLPDTFTLRPLFLGFIEMTTGIEEISKTMSGTAAAAAILASAAFGGLSGAAQTGTVIKNAGLSIRHYVLWKLLHAALSSLFLILLSCR